MSLRFEADALGCYLKVRDGAPLNITNDDLEPCTTRGRLVLLRWNEDKHEIERIAEVTDPRVNVGIRAYKVENDDKAMIGEPLEKHQAMAEKLGVRLLSTKKLDLDGSRIVLLTCTSGGLDAPNRLRAEITVTVGYKDEVYEVKKKILLHSLPFRDKGDANAYSAMLKRDDEICENLTNIKIQIYSKYMKNLFSLYYFIGRMIDGYDPNFGYDQRQVEKVYELWINFIRDNFAVANAQAEKVTLATHSCRVCATTADFSGVWRWVS